MTLVAHPPIFGPLPTPTTPGRGGNDWTAIVDQLAARSSTVRMFLHREDAMALCSDPRTAGRAHMSEWILMWTSITNMRKVLGDRMRLQVTDDGRFDGLLDELGAVKVPLTHQRVAPLLDATR